MGGIFRADRHIHVKKGGVHLLNKEIRELLPERLRGLVERVVLKEEKLQEIRIRREKGIALRYDGDLLCRSKNKVLRWRNGKS